MRRFETDVYGCVFDIEDGSLVMYEEARQIEVDRDIKTANLQLLAEKVLDYHEMAEAAIGDEEHVDTLESKRLLAQLVELARGLKR